MSIFSSFSVGYFTLSGDGWSNERNAFSQSARVGPCCLRKQEEEEKTHKLYK